MENFGGLLTRGAVIVRRALYRVADAVPQLVSRECAGQIVTFHETLPQWIGGHKVFSPGSPLIEKRYPTTGELLYHVFVSDTDIVDQGIEYACSPPRVTLLTLLTLHVFDLSNCSGGGGGRGLQGVEYGDRPIRL
jgi:hypothetical protein